MSSHLINDFIKSGSVVELIPKHFSESLRVDFGRCSNVHDDLQSKTPQENALDKLKHRKLVLWQKSSSDIENLRQRFRIVLHNDSHHPQRQQQEQQVHEEEDENGEQADNLMLVAFESIAMFSVVRDQAASSERNLHHVVCASKNSVNGDENDDDDEEEGGHCFVSPTRICTKTLSTKFRLIPASDDKNYFLIQPVFEVGDNDRRERFHCIQANEGRGLGAEIAVTSIVADLSVPGDHQLFRISRIAQTLQRNSEKIFTAATHDVKEHNEVGEKYLIDDGDIFELIPQHNGGALRVAVNNNNNHNNNIRNDSRTVHLWHSAHQRQDVSAAGLQRWKVRVRSLSREQPENSLMSTIVSFSPLAFPSCSLSCVISETTPSPSPVLGLKPSDDLDPSQSFIVSNAQVCDEQQENCLIMTICPLARRSWFVGALKGRGLGAELCACETGGESPAADFQQFEFKLIAKTKQNQLPGTYSTMLQGEVPRGYVG